MPVLNYAKEYSQALDQQFPFVLYFGALYATPNNSRYRWLNAKTIEIPTISTTGRVDGDRDTIETAKRNYNNKWIPKALANFRKWSTLVHPMDVDETNQVTSIENITMVYNQEQKFPEMDAYTISKIHADYVALGKAPTTTPITEANILSVFDNMMKNMNNKRVPKAGRILYVTPATYTMLKNAEKIQRTLNVQSGETHIDRNVYSLDSVKIEEIPDDLMRTAYDFTTGWVIGATAKQIHMALIHPLGVITPVKYEFSKLDTPSAMSEGKYVYYEESYEDVFILDNKVDAIEFVEEA